MTGPDIVFFDGGCGMCHATVRFILRRDAAGRFAFAPLRGESGAGDARTDPAAAAEPAGDLHRRVAVVRRQFAAGVLPDSVLVLPADGRLLDRSDAVVHILRAVGGAWGACGAVLTAVPRPVRDAVYRAVARVRRGFAPAPVGACPVLPPEQARRFVR